MKLSKLVTMIERLVFGYRPFLLMVFAAVTVFMLFSASGLKVDAGFNKLVPMEHEYMKAFNNHRDEFGGANRLLIALISKEGDIFTPDFFDTLEKATDDVFFFPGINRSRVSSIFTPDTFFTEVTEDGFAGGNVISADFEPTPEKLERVRSNLLKSNYMGELISNDFSGAMIKAELLEIDPTTGEKLDYLKVAKLLEEFRGKYESDNISVHIIGFAKVVGDMTDGTSRVVLFFGLAFIITALMVYRYTRSAALTMIALLCSVVAVIWQLGMLPLLGFGIDPMGVLVPFLIFAIGVSHGVQMVSANGAEVFDGATSLEAARNSFRRLLAPGAIALASDTIGFLTIYLIEIRVIQEMAVTASLGVAAIILTNLVLMPVCLSYVRYGKRYRENLHRRAERSEERWYRLSFVASPKVAVAIIAVSALLGLYGAWKGGDIAIGDVHAGVPELRQSSRYNVDTALITEKFSVGVDIISIFAEGEAGACIDYEALGEIDDMSWHFQNLEGVQSAVSLPVAMKIANAGWNEGAVSWRVIPRNAPSMTASLFYLPPSTGLRNDDCSVMPIYLFTKDHKASTISSIVDAVSEFNEISPPEKVKFTLAGNNLGVMAATNEEVLASQFPILLYVFSAVIILCLVTFRSLRAMLCIVIPLGLVSLLGYALMTLLEIGLKVNTMPVVALGVGVGVDYGIYIFSRLKSIMDEGVPLRRAYELTLDITGSSVILTGLTLGAGVATWIFSPLKFQADMGILLTFLFIVNMLGAIVLLPAIAAILFPVKPAQ